MIEAESCVGLLKNRETNDFHPILSPANSPIMHLCALFAPVLLALVSSVVVAAPALVGRTVPVEPQERYTPVIFFVCV